MPAAYNPAALSTRGKAARMAAPKKATRKRKAPARKAGAKRAGSKTLSATHKAALAKGRTMASAIDRYLRALHTPKKRGRQVSPAQLRARLGAAEHRAKTAVGIDRVLAHQEVLTCRARLAANNGSGPVDLKRLEADFVKAAGPYSEAKGITYGAWRKAGVPAQVLGRARIARTRGNGGSE